MAGIGEKKGTWVGNAEPKNNQIELLIQLFI